MWKHVEMGKTKTDHDGWAIHVFFNVYGLTNKKNHISKKALGK